MGIMEGITRRYSMMNLAIRIYIIFILLISIGGTMPVLAQMEAFNIDTIISNPNDGTIDFYVRALDEKGRKLNLTGVNTKVYEVKGLRKLQGSRNIFNRSRFRPITNRCKSKRRSAYIYGRKERIYVELER